MIRMYFLLTISPTVTVDHQILSETLPTTSVRNVWMPVREYSCRVGRDTKTVLFITSTKEGAKSVENSKYITLK